MDYTARAKELCRIFNNSSPEAERMAEEWLRKFGNDGEIEVLCLIAVCALVGALWLWML